MGLQALRGLALGISAIATFYAFTHLELVTAFSIIFLSPLAAKIISVFLNRERIALSSWLTSFAGFSGVLLVLRPGTVPIGIGEIAALCVPLTFALGFVLSRTIGEENHTPLSTLLFMNLAIAFFTLIPTARNFMPMSYADFPLTIFIAFTGALGTLLVARAYAQAPTAYVSPLHYTQIIWGVIWGALFFREFPDAWTLAGAAIIIGAGLILVWQSRSAAE
jgi:drug/metabolite transporter (DMT)-like permease